MQFDCNIIMLSVYIFIKTNSLIFTEYLCLNSLTLIEY